MKWIQILLPCLPLTTTQRKQQQKFEMIVTFVNKRQQHHKEKLVTVDTSAITTSVVELTTATPTFPTFVATTQKNNIFCFVLFYFICFAHFICWFSTTFTNFLFKKRKNQKKKNFFKSVGANHFSHIDQIWEYNPLWKYILFLLAHKS